MKLFLATTNSPQEAAIIAKRLEEHYAENYLALKNGVCWIVAANGTSTTSDIADVLLNPTQEEGKGETVPGIITEIESYYGLYDLSVWEKMKAWREAS